MMKIKKVLAVMFMIASSLSMVACTNENDYDSSDASATTTAATTKAQTTVATAGDSKKNDTNSNAGNSSYSNGKSNNSDNSSKEEYFCMGKGDTCKNKTSDPYDLYCYSCDPDGNNIEGDQRNSKSDGHVGDNDYDGDIDEKDWEQEWNNYLNDKLDDYDYGNYWD